MDRPEALNGARGMEAALAAALREAFADRGCRSAVVTGAGDVYFVADHRNNDDFGPSTRRRHATRGCLAPFFDAFLTAPKPLVAALNGRAYGAGATAATLCDVVLGAPRAALAFPFRRWRVVPEGAASVHVARLVGAARASALLRDGGAARDGLATLLDVPGEPALDAERCRWRAGRGAGRRGLRSFVVHHELGADDGAMRVAEARAADAHQRLLGAVGAAALRRAAPFRGDVAVYVAASSRTAGSPGRAARSTPSPRRNRALRAANAHLSSFEAAAFAVDAAPNGGDRGRLSSFGFSGTIAAVLRRGAPTRRRRPGRSSAGASARSHAPPISEAAVAGPAGRRGVEIFEAARVRPTGAPSRDLADAAARASGRRLPSRKIDALAPLPRARLAAAARPKPVVRASKKKLPISTPKTRRNAQRPDAAVRAAAVDVLGTSVSWDAPIFQQGLDSVSAAEFSRVLGDRLGSAVPATLLFDHPTVRDASRAVAGAAAPENECSQAPVRPVSSPASSRTEVARARHRCERDHGELAARCLAAAGRVPSARWDVAAGGDAATYGSFVRLRADAGGLAPRRKKGIVPRRATAGHALIAMAALSEVDRRRRDVGPATGSPPALRRPRRARSPTTRRASRATRPAKPVGDAALALRRALGTAAAADAPLVAQGVDSVAAVEVARLLGASLGTCLPSTLLFDHPTVSAVESAIARPAVPSDAREPASRGPRARPSTSAPRLSLVGRASVCPGIACGDKLRELLLRSRSAATSAPVARVGRGESYGAFLGAALALDASAFGIPALEARGLAPQMGLALEVANALSKDARAAANVAVFLGAGATLGATTGGANMPLSVFSGTSAALSVASGRVSYALGLVGPAVSLDTACSSSLVAVHLAAGCLRRREAASALAMGVSVLDEAVTLAFSAAGMLSPRGRCHAFDGRADGYCRGEGCGAFVLALDVSEVTLGASAVQQDGASASLTAPNGTSQRRLLLAVAGHGKALEAHGTGTALGDPIEVGAAAAALDAPACASIKGNVGHLEASAAASALAALLGVVFERGVLCANAHLRSINAHLVNLLGYGSFVGQECFDAAAFGVGLPEGRVLQLQQVLLLNVGLATVFAERGLARTDVSVFVGVEPSDAETATLSVFSATGSAVSVVSGRVSLAS
ncbi:delta-3,5-delta-2,4-dienoyl-CoA isomerase [Aureococcus anophagefferens]|nr:delta-3,5-delta-2,4-dienoyl-CoA isomerase [Aureococcus anophagefferens]